MRKNILVIEDDAEVLRVYTTILAEFGAVRTAETMAQARPQLQGIDLIILDYHLKNETMKFEDIIAELKPVAPILVCSGISGTQIREIGARLGVAGYWNKGLGLEGLRTKVRTILSA